MTHAIVDITDISKLFTDLAPLYVARATLEKWLSKYDIAIGKTEIGYKVIAFDHKLYSDMKPHIDYPTYGEALVVALDECVARAKAKSE